MDQSLTCCAQPRISQHTREQSGRSPCRPPSRITSRVLGVFAQCRCRRSSGHCNRERTPLFLATQTAVFCGLQDAFEKTRTVHQFFVKVGQQAVRLEQRQAEDPETLQPPPTVSPVPLVVPHIIATRLEKLQTRYGHPLVHAVLAWWQVALTEGEPRWLSPLQLLVDFQMSTGLHGPVYSAASQSWREPTMAANGRLPDYSVHQRTRWFRRLLTTM